MLKQNKSSDPQLVVTAVKVVAILLINGSSAQVKLTFRHTYIRSRCVPTAGATQCRLKRHGVDWGRAAGTQHAHVRSVHTESTRGTAR